MFLFV
jgi:hypothetical protein